MVGLLMIKGKSEFYQKAKEALTTHGYQYFDGDKDIRGKGIHHASKPDYIAVKGDTIIIGEIKSPAESPKSGSWRKIQKNDSEEFKKVRLEVLKREKEGEIAPEVGGHEIIIRGQIPDYVQKIGVTYEIPESICKFKKMLMGYTFPKSEEMNVLQALKKCKKPIIKKIDTGNNSVTLFFCYKGEIMVKVLIQLGKTLGMGLVKKFGKIAAKRTAQKIGAKIVTEVVIQGGTMLAEKGIDKLFSDKEMSFEKKLDQLKKFRDSGEITPEEYYKYYHALMDSHFS